METSHNQELVATILEDNVANELQTIKIFCVGRIAFSIDLMFTSGKGTIILGMKACNSFLSGLHLPIDLPTELFNSRLTPSEKKP